MIGKILLRVLLPALVLGVCAWGGWHIYVNRTEPDIMMIPPALLRVDGVTLRPGSFPVVARSQGTVQARTRSVLTAEVGGRVVKISPSFRPGGRFAAGEVLVELDRLDLETAAAAARATLAQAEAILVDEEARAAQAVEGWRALGRKDDPPPLVCRAHIVARAEADVGAARAEVERADRNLGRASLRAPYNGAVLRQNVDLGQVIAAGADLGEIFAADLAEVRLPLPEREMGFLSLPVVSSGDDNASEVRLRVLEGGNQAVWPGRLVRVEAAVDDQTRQTVAVALVSDAFTPREPGAPALRVGQFVEAEIQGRVLENVFVLPRAAVRAGNEVVLITPENRLKRMRVEPLTGDAAHVVVAAGVEGGPADGDVLCVTPIPFPVNGAKVLPSIDGRVERPGMAGAEEGRKAKGRAS
jgi:multidrug efflux system membrane fusion protein